MNPTKRMGYSDFMKLTVQERKMQSQYFLKNKPGMIPVILKKNAVDLPQLKNCKFLVNENSQMAAELASMRSHIVKNSLNKITKDDQLFFYSNSRIVSPNVKGVVLYDSVKNTLQDGWLVITYTKEATFGHFQQERNQ